MSFKDFIVDTIKYTFQEKTTFLIFGLLLVVLAFLPVEELMSFEISYYISNIPILLVTFILVAIQGGYLSKIFEDFVKGSDTMPSPKFSELTLYLKEGVKDLILGMFYSIPFLSIMIIPEALGDLFLILMLIVVILAYVALLIIQTAILYTVIDDYKKAFNVIYIFKKSKEIGFKRLHLVLILSILILVVVSSITLTNNDPIMTIILIAVGFILYPILAIMDVRYLGLIGREIINKK